MLMSPRATHNNNEDHIQIDFSALGAELNPDETSETESISAPFDPTLIRIDSKILTLDLILTRIREGEMDLAPNFQRNNNIWDATAQSRLIESLLIRIPLPAFYMDATDDNRWLVVDGSQRLSALKHFAIDKTTRLKSLEYLSQFEGYSYDDLPRNLQRRINETQITVFLIEEGTPEEVKFNIFKRINTGGLPLSAQEIRHALNQGPANDYITSLARTTEFRTAVDDGVSDLRMADRECVLRFLAFILSPPEDYKSKEFDIFLNQQMASLNRMSSSDLETLGNRFVRSMNAARNILGEYAFRKVSKKNPRRGPVNKSLFEAWAVNLDRLTDTQLVRLIEQRSKLILKYMDLMDVNDFMSSISLSTGDVVKIKRRFSYIGDIIKDALND